MRIVLMENIRELDFSELGMTQEDIGGDPPIPLGPPPLFLSVFQFP